MRADLDRPARLVQRAVPDRGLRLDAAPIVPIAGLSSHGARGYVMTTARCPARPNASQERTMITPKMQDALCAHVEQEFYSA